MLELPALQRLFVRSYPLLFLALISTFVPCAQAQERPNHEEAAQQEGSASASHSEGAAEMEAQDTDEGTPGSEVTIGEGEGKSNRTNANSGAALRNENVFAAKVDMASAKADTQRLGGSYVIVPHPVVETNFYATEHGQPTTELPVLNRSASLGGWHGEIFETLQNSVFNEIGRAHV